LRRRYDNNEEEAADHRVAYTSHEGRTWMYAVVT
jgi:hypothetical protein